MPEQLHEPNDLEVETEIVKMGEESFATEWASEDEKQEEDDRRFV